ncbi:MAG: 30S ribosomal protein S19e [Thermoplasmata archaeon]
MTTVFDVPADALITRVAEKLKQMPELAPPEWAAYVKTGPHREKPPEQRDWWHIRMAAILRKVYILGPVGSSRLSAKFGGARDRRDAPNISVKGSGSISRKGLQQLERAGLVTTTKGRGRVVTPKGRRLLDNTAHEVAQELEKKLPELAKY